MSKGASFNFGDIPQGRLDPEAAGSVRRRYPMGLPGGSVRALLTFLVLGLFWAILLLPPDRNVQVPVFLYYLMFLIVGHYFAARGYTRVSKSGREKSPLWLPRGTIRIIILAGFGLVLAYSFVTHGSLRPLFDRLQPNRDEIIEQPYLPLIMLAAFFIGVGINRLAKMFLATPEGLPYWFQDIQAWVALLGVLMLSVEVMIQLVILPSSPDLQERLNFSNWQTILTAIVAFYFGARSVK